jgi:hypothetical protein
MVNLEKVESVVGGVRQIIQDLVPRSYVRLNPNYAHSTAG